MLPASSRATAAQEELTCAWPSVSSSSAAATVNKTYDYDVSNFDYIKITAQPNGVGNLATLTIKNISVTK